MTLLLALLTALPSHAGGVTVVGGFARDRGVGVGERVEGSVLVRNDGDSPARLVVTLRDYVSTADGVVAYPDPGTSARSNAAWVLVGPTELTLAPGEAERVRYRLDVPLDPALAGTYWSVLLVEPAARPAAEPVAAPLPAPLSAPRAAPEGRAVSTRVVRYAVQLVTHVNDADAALSIERPELVGEERRLSVDLRNVGARLLAPRVWVELYDAAGRRAGRYRARGRPELFPGCSARYRVDLGRVPPGAYTALTVADAGRDAVFGAEYTLELR